MAMVLMWALVTSDKDTQVQRERHLNDRLRREMTLGSVRIRGGAKQLSNDQLCHITQLIQSFDDFRPDSDVSELHDNGVVEFEGVNIVWLPEACDEEVSFRPSNCTDIPRNLVVMLAGEIE